MRLYFIRLLMRYQTPDYYEDRTDVWVFGDLAGYEYFVEQLNRAKTATENIHVKCSTNPPNSMRAVITPAQRRIRKPRVKIIERVVLLDREFEMELVIVGNAAGYAKLSRILTGVTDHEHVDDSRGDHFAEPRSVALNIRAPLKRWSKKGLQYQAYLVYERQPSFLPSGLLKPDPKLNRYDEADTTRWPLKLGDWNA